MNPRTIILALVATNALSLLALGYFVKSRNPPAPTAPAATKAEAKSVSGPTASKDRKVVVTQTVTNTLAQKFDWRIVESPDYKQYIANLRSIGCPEETIRDIIVADVGKLFDARKKELAAGGKKFEFWKGGDPFTAFMRDPERIEKQQALMKEKRALLTDLLGSAPEEKIDPIAMMTGGVNPFETMLDFLPSEKQTQVMQAYMKLQEKMMKEMGAGGGFDAEDSKKMQKMKKDAEAEMLKFLTPQEKEEFDLRMSDTAMQMRYGLAGFEMTEQEFRDVFKLRKKFDDDYGGRFGGDGEEQGERAKRAKAEAEMNDQLKAALGETRAAEYKRAQDYDYQQLHRISQRNQLPKETAAKVYDMKKAAQDQAQKVNQDSSLSPQQKTETLRAIRAETERSVTAQLGEKGFKSYQNQGGWWMRNIAPDPPRKEPTALPAPPQP
jgi:hypothetical protein